MNSQTQTSVRVKHIRAFRLTVSDADRLQNFYIKALGFEPVSDILVEENNYSDLEEITGKIRIVTLRLGDELIELMHYPNIEGQPIPPDSQSNDLWFQHFAIVVSDIDRAYDRLRQFTIEFISVAPQTIPPSNKASAGVRAFKFKDPDRHSLELIWFPPDKGKDKWHQIRDRLFLGIDHSAIAVANTEESLQFYRDLLGMQVEGESLNRGETQARLDGLPEVKVRITQLGPAQTIMGIELLDYIIPANGRPIPSDRKSHDIARVQVELVVDNIELVVKILRENGVRFLRSQLIEFADTKSTYRQGCSLEDPTGHAILLIG